MTRFKRNKSKLDPSDWKAIEQLFNNLLASIQNKKAVTKEELDGLNINVNSNDRKRWFTASDLLALFALVANVCLILITQNSVKVAQKALEDSRINTETARKALDIQVEKNAFDEIQDKIKNKQDSLLTAQQISALRAQAKALREGVNLTSISQKPYIRIEDPGFYRFDPDAIDSVSLACTVFNYGQRPAILKYIELYLLDDRFECRSTIKADANIPLVNNSSFFSAIFPSQIGNAPSNNRNHIDDILKSGNLYFYFVAKYTDPYESNIYKVEDAISIFKWRSINKKNLFVKVNPRNSFYSLNLCSEVEEMKITESVTAYQKSHGKSLTSPK